MNKLIAFIFIASFSLFGNSFPQYQFLNVEKNELILNESKSFDNFFNKMDTLIQRGEGKINILHIGDSHIQGGFFSETIREYLQKYSYGLNGGRGFLFPYRVARTNGPWNYFTKYSGSWYSCRNVERRKNCNLGLSGYNLSTKSTKARISIGTNAPDGLVWDFNKIKVYHDTNTSYKISIGNKSLNETAIYTKFEYYTLIELRDYKDTVDLIFTKGENEGTDEFVLHGISLDNDDPGIVYHALGVNGAEVFTWLRCNLFEEHLKTLNPDLVIISLGTNDAYPSSFNKAEFDSLYREFNSRILNSVDDVSIIMTTPGDNYRRRRYSNRNNSKATDIIKEIGKDMKLPVWDFYYVMGGLGSINSWYRNGLSAGDKLHLSKAGYILQGELFYNAFIKAYEKHIENKEYSRIHKIERY